MDAGIFDRLAVQLALAPGQPVESLSRTTHELCHARRQNPELVEIDVPAVAAEQVAARIPEIYGAAVGDVEGLAVDFLVV